MTDSPTSQAMHLAMTELKERAERVAELEEALRRISLAKPDRLDHSIDVAIIERAAALARSVLNKETNRE